MRAVPTLLAALLLAFPAFGQSSDPLRYMPPIADLVIKIEKPRALLESVFELPLYERVMKLKATEQFIDTANFRKFRELVAFFEKDLGKPWPELVDGIAGGGIAVGVHYAKGREQPPAMLVLQAKDEELLKRFLARAVEILNQEGDRAGGKGKVEADTAGGFETYRIDESLYVMRDGPVLVLAAEKFVLDAALEQAKKVKADPKAASMANHAGAGEARKSVGPDAHAWLWFNLGWAKAQEGAKDILAMPRNDTNLTVLFAGLLDLGRRSNAIAAGLTATPKGYDLSIKLPVGFEGRGGDTIIHLPAGTPGDSAMPLLRPKNAIFTHGFYLDLNALYADRAKIFNAEIEKSFAEGQKQLSKVLPGGSLEKLLASTGPVHQVVFAHSDKLPYSVAPKQRIPPGAFLLSLKDKKSSRDFEVMARAGGTLATASGAPLKLTEEKYQNVKMLTWRFDEKRPYPNDGDPDNFRFNFAPTYANLGDRIIFSATPDLCKELIDLAKNPAKPTAAKGYENMAMEFHADGLAALLNADPQAVVTQLILANALREADAQKEAKRLMEYIGELGVLRISTTYEPKAFRMDFRWTIK